MTHDCSQWGSGPDWSKLDGLFPMVITKSYNSRATLTAKADVTTLKWAGVEFVERAGIIIPVYIADRDGLDSLSREIANDLARRVMTDIGWRSAYLGGDRLTVRYNDVEHNGVTISPDMI